VHRLEKLIWLFLLLLSSRGKFDHQLNVLLQCLLELHLALQKLLQV
jgi:hypothetical protein